MSSLFLNILPLIAPTQLPDNLFHSLTVLCENENFLIFSLHCFFANGIPCPLVLLSSLTDNKIFLSVFSDQHNIFLSIFLSTYDISVAFVLFDLFLLLLCNYM